MKRLRTVLRRSLKPFALAAVAVGLCFSLTVTTTQKAEANPLLLPPLLLASGTMPVGTALGLVSLTGPIGWGIAGVAVLGLGLAATQEYWLPYVTGDFGEPKENLTNSPGTGFGPINNNITLSGANISGRFASATMTYANQPSNGGFFSYTIATRYQCKWDNGTPDTVVNTWFTGTNVAFPTGPISLTRECRATVAGTTKLGVPVGSEWGLIGTRNFAAYNSTDHKGGGPTNYISAGAFNAGETAFDPKSVDTKYSTTVECVKPDGTFFSLTAASTGADGAIKFPSCDAAFPGSHGTGKTDVVGTGPGKAPETLWNNPRIPASSEYPLCAPERPGPMCSLSVVVDGKPCAEAVGTWNCANWREIANQDSTRVQCSYGPYAGLAVDVCNPMERAYESPGGVLGTEPNLDGNPATRNDSSPQGEPYQRPETGTGTGMGTAPSSGTNPGTTPGESGQNCLSQGWSWNPVSWVMVPTQCALQWAFVPPKTRIDAAIETVIPKMELRGINPFVIPVMTSLGSLSGSGCQGPAFDLSAIHIPQTYYFFSACEAPMSHIATGVNSFFALSIVVQGGMSCIRGVAAAFGFNWGLGKGGEDDK